MNASERPTSQQANWELEDLAALSYPAVEPDTSDIVLRLDVVDGDSIDTIRRIVAQPPIVVDNQVFLDAVPHGAANPLVAAAVIALTDRGHSLELHDIGNDRRDAATHQHSPALRGALR